MKTYLLFPVLIISLFISTITYAANKETRPGTPATISVKGVVLDQDTKEKLAGVTISVGPDEQKIYSEADGTFSIEGLPQGTWSITFRCISYKEKTITVDTQDLKKGKLNLQLEPVTP